MNNTTIYLIRHGEAEYPLNNKGERLLYGPDVDLSADGRKGVGLLGRQLLKDRAHIDVIYTSPIKRCVQTADIVAEILGIQTIIQNENLREALAPGYIGAPYKDIIAVGGNTYEHPRSPDQETIVEISKRMSQGFITIFREIEPEGKIATIVSHGDPLRTLIELLKNPENPIPNPSTMRDENYLEKGTAVKLVLDSSMRVLEHEFINSNKKGKQRIEKKF